MRVETELEDDGRWIAEVPALPAAMAYGSSRAEAISKVEALVLRILADRVDNGEDDEQTAEGRRPETGRPSDQRAEKTKKR